jgi:hypothetical protein
MKKLTFICVVLLLNQISLFGQATETFETAGRSQVIYSKSNTQKSGAVVVTLGTIDSKMTSREKVLAYPRLLVQELNCEVMGFTFSISNGKESYGPYVVKGAVFTEDITDRVKELEAPPSVRITIDNIMVKCNGQDASANTISLEYDH